MLITVVLQDNIRLDDKSASDILVGQLDEHESRRGMPDAGLLPVPFLSRIAQVANASFLGHVACEGGISLPVRGRSFDHIPRTLR